jgi:hypothetical protein
MKTCFKALFAYFICGGCCSSIIVPAEYYRKKQLKEVTPSSPFVDVECDYLYHYACILFPLTRMSSYRGSPPAPVCGNKELLILLLYVFVIAHTMKSNYQELSLLLMLVGMGAAHFVTVM